MKSNSASTSNLQKHYGTFSPRERLALIFAAIAREDDAERLALIDSAPVFSYRMADYHGEADAFNLMCLFHIAKQLDNAYMNSLLALAEGNDAKQNERLYEAGRISGYVFCVYADAWRAFCEGLGIDADAALKGLPGAQSLENAEQISRTFAYTREEAQASQERAADRLQLQGELITVESVAEEMRETFERWVKFY